METVLFLFLASLLPFSSASPLSNYYYDYYSQPVYYNQPDYYSQPDYYNQPDYNQPAQPQPSGNTQVSPGQTGSDQEYCQLGSDHTMCQYQVNN